MKSIIILFLKHQWKEWRLFLFFVIFIFIPLRASVASWYWVPSGSMNPTILEGDLVFVDKLAYDLKVPLTEQRVMDWDTPHRGDIVVTESPASDVNLVKRVVGIPGDTLEMRENVLFLNGQALQYTALNESHLEYLSDDLKESSIFAQEQLGEVAHSVMSVPQIPASRNFDRVQIPDGQYFIMGDNRDNSQDSRYFGFIEEEAIFGKAKGVIVSFNILDKYQPRLNRFFSSLYSQD